MYIDADYQGGGRDGWTGEGAADMVRNLVQVTVPSGSSDDVSNHCL